MTNIKNIGFIGIGNMGVADGRQSEARRLRGDRLRSRSRARASASRRSMAAARAPSSPISASACDAVVTMLPTGREVREALFTCRSGALAANLKPGAIVIDMSSADPVGTRELGAELAARKIELVDAPVSGGVPRAKDGSLAIMIGGDAAAVAEVQAGARLHGQKAVRGRLARLRPRHEMPEQFPRRDQLRRRRRSGDGRPQIRARSEGHDRRDQCLDRPQLRLRKC